MTAGAKIIAIQPNISSIWTSISLMSGVVANVSGARNLPAALSRTHSDIYQKKCPVAAIRIVYNATTFILINDGVFPKKFDEKKIPTKMAMNNKPGKLVG